MMEKEKKPVGHLSHIRVQNIGFLYTSKCNYKCEFCSNQSSPARNEKLDPNIVGERIDEAARLEIAGICFSGGECTLYLDEILPLIKKARNNGQIVAITTNGHWGRTKKSAAVKVSLLKDAGLNTVDISYGEFYAKAGARIKQVKNIIDECTKAGIKVGVTAVRKTRTDIYSDKIGRELQSNKLPVQISSMLPYGFARTNFPRHKNFYARYPIDYFLRCNSICRMVYTSNGELYPCCGQGVFDATKNGPSRYLSLGNIYNETLEKSLKRAENSLFLLILAIMGPRGFNILCKEYPNDVGLPEELVFPCDLCIFASQNNKFGEWFAQLEKDSDKIRDRIYKCHEILHRWGITPYKFTN
jgi:MoaA/NifB/PqqE/SkfB family radical SAM enzyme